MGKSLEKAQNDLSHAVSGYKYLTESIQAPQEKITFKNDINEKISAIYDKMYDFLETTPPDSEEGFICALE